MTLSFVCVFSSYGSVFKAIHKESGQVVAIKQVPVESDLQEIIKEISIMQQCDRCDSSMSHTIRPFLPLKARFFLNIKNVASSKVV